MNPAFDNLNTRKSDRVKEKSARLAKLMERHLGVPVARYTAIARAVDEALDRWEKLPPAKGR